jgi:hypothetical protein
MRKRSTFADGRCRRFKDGAISRFAALSYAASQKGDNALAAKLARILERNWDKAEDYGGETALSNTNHALFDEIDKAMDRFISPLVAHPTAATDAVVVKAAYTAHGLTAVHKSNKIERNYRRLRQKLVYIYCCVFDDSFFGLRNWWSQDHVLGNG